MEDTNCTNLLIDIGVSQSTIEIETIENDPNIDFTVSQIGTGPREVLFVWKMIGATAPVFVSTLIGATIGVTLWFAFKSTPISAFQLHVGLSVIGYQLLMTHGVLCLRVAAGAWTILSFKHRRRVHWILQVSGSALAIAGSVIMIRAKESAGRSHFNTVHGKLALAALVFTCASLINGVLSLFAVELRRFMPTKLNKLGHIIFGSATLATSSACLCYGFLKRSFVEWASQEMAYVLISSVVTYTVIILLAPSYAVIKRLSEWKTR